MKTLIIVAGLPGVGKSHICRLLKKRIKGLFYFDSDLFGKRAFEKRKLALQDLSPGMVRALRLAVHRSKLVEIKKRFRTHSTIAIDTCFDLPGSRKMFYEFVRKNKLRLIVLELSCPQKIARSRIFERRHETERTVGSKKSRWGIYLEMKRNWRPISPPKIIINSASAEDINRKLKKLLSLILKAPGSRA